MLKARHATLILLALLLCACQSAYYGAMEKVGYHKRDIMINRVEEVQDAQTDAKEQFSSALEQYQAMVNTPDSELQDYYDKLNSEYEDSKEAAQEVTDRIDAVENVSEALFEEWEEEINLYSNTDLKRQSLSKMNGTKKKYNSLMKSMRQAEERMNPVLRAFQDQVLFLKHNLNARAIDSLKGELKNIETNVAQLIKDMEKSIAESNSFIEGLKNTG
jgi:predicted RND superfamily exporter protein